MNAKKAETKPATFYVLYTVGFDDRVVGKHKTREAAVAMVERKVLARGLLSPGGYRVLASDDPREEVVEIMGTLMARPR